MKLTTWMNPLVTFLSNGNTVILKDESEIQSFIKQMKVLGIDSSILKRASDIKGAILVEFNNGKGTTWWNGSHSYPTIGKAIQASAEWFGVNPYNWDDINFIDNLSKVC